MEQVILVDDNDEMTGIGEKMWTHLQGKLHRAFSVFVFDRAGQLLLQKRAETKYHSSNLWSNTCCGHPRPGESIESAAHRRLQEEMGFDCRLQEIFTFTYKVEFDSNLSEHEYDHVLRGVFDGEPSPNVREVSDWTWMDVDTLMNDIASCPDRYTYWLRLAIGRVHALRPSTNFAGVPDAVGGLPSNAESPTGLSHGEDREGE